MGCSIWEKHWAWELPLYNSLQDSLLSVPEEVLYHLSKLLTANITLRNSPGKEQAGPWIRGIPSKMCRNSKRPVKEYLSTQDARGLFPIWSSFHHSDCHLLRKSYCVYPNARICPLVGTTWDWGKTCHYSFLSSTNMILEDLLISIILSSRLIGWPKFTWLLASGSIWKVFFY